MKPPTYSKASKHRTNREPTRSQIYRLIGPTPERMNLGLLAALLDVLDCTFEELCPSTVVASPTRHRRRH